MMASGFQGPGASHSAGSRAIFPVVMTMGQIGQLSFAQISLADPAVELELLGQLIWNNEVPCDLHGSRQSFLR